MIEFLRSVKGCGDTSVQRWDIRTAFSAFIESLLEAYCIEESMSGKKEV